MDLTKITNDDTLDAIDYVKRYQSWRRGEDDRPMEEAGLTPKKIGDAIDITITVAELFLEVARKKYDFESHLSNVEAKSNEEIKNKTT